MAVSAIGASAANADPATFSQNGPVASGPALTTTIVKVGNTPTPATTLTCTSATAGGGSVLGQTLTGFNVTDSDCTDGLGRPASIGIWNYYAMVGNKSGTSRWLSGTKSWYGGVSTADDAYQLSPSLATSYTGTWTNGQSKVAFADAAVGKVMTGGGPLAGQTVTITGTYRVLVNGGYVTLN